MSEGDNSIKQIIVGVGLGTISPKEGLAKLRVEDVELIDELFKKPSLDDKDQAYVINNPYKDLIEPAPSYVDDKRRKNRKHNNRKGACSRNKNKAAKKARKTQRNK